MFNVSEIVENQVPDAEGNVIPATVREGSAEIVGPLGPAQHILVAVDASTYNVQKATCGFLCLTCYGVEDTWIELNPFAVAVGGQTQLSFIEEWSGGMGDFDYTKATGVTWSSDHTNIATVSKGLATGVSAGSAQVYVAAPEELEPGISCANPPVACDEPMHLVNPEPAPGTVKPVITSITPDWGKVGNNVAVTISGTGFGTTPTVGFDGTGITVTYGTRSDTTITGTFTIASSAPVGVQDVTVTNAGVTSSPVSFQVTPTTPTPVNFRQTAVQDAGSGNLKFTYQWDSSTGNPDDLSTCTVGESVAYPGSGNFNWASPPYDKSGNPTTNPTIGSFSGSDGGFYDNQVHPGFLKPYVSNSFTATQTFRYNCGSGTVVLVPNIAIVRSVQENAQNVWTYTVTKSGSMASTPLP